MHSGGTYGCDWAENFAERSGPTVNIDKITGLEDKGDADDLARSLANVDRADVSERGPTYDEQRAWEEDEQRFFRGLGEELREIFPRERWHDLEEAEREQRFAEARRHLHRRMAIKRPVPIVWTDDPQNEGAGYDQTSADGEIHYPRHHLSDAEPEHLVRGLCEEMRHAWQDDVHRGLTEHPLGDVGKREFDHGFATYDETNPLNDSTNRLELDAKERTEWCVDGYVGRDPNEYVRS